MTPRHTEVLAGVVLLLCLLLLPSLADASADLTTFESFYRIPWHLSPGDWVMITVGALVAGALVIWAAPAAGPVLSAVGSWIGGMFGYSGIAATNFGLALLGGGAVASGGLGMAGGVALLTAAFSFGTDIVVDFASRSAIETYQYAKFADASREMTAMPLPRNDRGSAAYKEAFKELQGVDAQQSLFTPSNQARIRQAIGKLEAGASGSTDKAEQSRDETALALLYFDVADFRMSEQHARVAYFLARNARIKPTMPAFLLATTRLYEDQFNYPDVIALLQVSVQEEPENPLIPALFTVFLDRLSYRINLGTLSPRALDAVSIVARLPVNEKEWVASQVVVLSRYVAFVKLEQQKVESLGRSSNQTIRNSPLTLRRVRQAMNDYENLIVSAKFVAGELSSFNTSGDTGQARAAQEANRLLTRYWDDRGRLGGIVRDLESYQALLQKRPERREQVAVATRQAEPGVVRWALAVLLVAIGFVFGILVSNRRKAAGA